MSSLTSKSGNHLAILDRILEENSGGWSREQAEALDGLYLSSPSPALTPEPQHPQADVIEQFAVSLELVKCRARLKLRSHGNA